MIELLYFSSWVTLQITKFIIPLFTQNPLSLLLGSFLSHVSSRFNSISSFTDDSNSVMVWGTSLYSSTPSLEHSSMSCFCLNNGVPCHTCLPSTYPPSPRWPFRDFQGLQQNSSFLRTLDILKKCTCFCWIPSYMVIQKNA